MTLRVRAYSRREIQPIRATLTWFRGRKWTLSVSLLAGGSAPCCRPTVASEWAKLPTRPPSWRRSWGWPSFVLRRLSRPFHCFGDCWPAVGRALVRVIAGAQVFAWQGWPIYALALFAQFA